ncbi:hypothetical protein KFL_005020020 [Klebsormidium nitens]|uniref:Uncharacterized protein n=1 Tax=Klebsormidium nitens TaxID=105231 RepID=A0A1Y1IJF1_KLENI|nr:hypothetical protein KFL_005020020 [Klebsormidium nitens]|eukprot:GAQ89241.1 hypothetical protein KFL_005020020 [Klebsormidium nitens]
MQGAGPSAVSDDELLSAPVLPEVPLRRLVDDFLEATGKSNKKAAADVFYLFEACCNNYGWDNNDKWTYEAAHAVGKDFIDVSGADVIGSCAREFFGYFVPRKVNADPRSLKKMATQMGRWFKWLHKGGHIDETKSRELQGLAKQKETDLPRGEQASQLLFQQSRMANLQEPIMDSADGYFEVERVSTSSVTLSAFPAGSSGGLSDPDALELTLPLGITQLLRKGDTVCLSLVRDATGDWKVHQSGNVYPDGNASD